MHVRAEIVLFSTNSPLWKLQLTSLALRRGSLKSWDRGPRDTLVSVTGALCEVDVLTAIPSDASLGRKSVVGGLRRWLR